MKLLEGEIYCEVHGCIHAENRDPYGYGYWVDGEEPECDVIDWRKVWVGGPIPLAVKSEEI